MAVGIISNTQNKAVYARSTPANLLLYEHNEVETTLSVNTGGLLLITASNIVLLISLNVCLKLAGISCIISMVDTAKLKSRAR